VCDDGEQGWKTAEPIEMSFGMWTGVGPGNHELDGRLNSPSKGAILRGKGAAHCKVGPRDSTP